MKLKFEISNLNWQSQFRHKNIYGCNFTMFDDKVDLPAECELIVDDPKKTIDDFQKTEFRPGKYTFMSQKAIDYVRKQLKLKYKDTPTALYIKNIEEA